MADIQKLKALAEAFPADLDFDTNSTPFFNGPNGESLGGESTGYCSIYGQPFEIEGEQYDGTEYVSICTKEFAEFICSARDGVLELIAEMERVAGENQRLRAGVESDLAEIDRIQMVYDAHFRKTRSYRMQRDQAKDESDKLKAENEALRRDAERYRWLRDKSESIHQFYMSTPIWFTGVKFNKENVDNTIDAAMSKEPQS
jgi:hypothetical protein